MFRNTSIRKATAVLFLLLAMAASGLAQIKSSAITGSVTDQSGALVPAATVVVTNEDTNIDVTVKTNEAGQYTAPYMSAGRYRVAITAGGFQTFLHTGITIGTSTTVRLDAVLVPGSLTTSVEVKAGAVALQTENATVQGAINSAVIALVPNINNNPIYYASLQAGGGSESPNVLEQQARRWLRGPAGDVVGADQWRGNGHQRCATGRDLGTGRRLA